MAYFKLDIPKVNESISSYKSVKNNCLEDLNYTYRSLEYLDSAWNDMNSLIFKEKIKRDRYKINEYFDYLDRLYNEIDKFKTNIQNVCYKQGYRNNTIVLKFDDSEINNCKRYLNKIIDLLNDSLNKINIRSFESNFENLNLIYNLRNEIKSIRTFINGLISDITNFTNSINNEIYNSRLRINRIGRFNLDLKLIDYRWKTTDLDIKLKNDIHIKEYQSVPNNNINISSKKYNINSNTNNQFNANINAINLKDSKSIENLNNNINLSIYSDEKIDLEDNKEIKGLNEDLIYRTANQANINMKDLEDINGLNNNVNQAIYNSKEINLEENKEITGLNENLVYRTANQNNINMKGLEDINGLNNNIDSNTIKQENINFDVNSNKLESIEDYKAKENNIQYSINNNVNLSDNISQVKINQSNINDNIVTNNYDLSSGVNAYEANNNGIGNIDTKNNYNLNSNINKIDSLEDLNK